MVGPITFCITGCLGVNDSLTIKFVTKSVNNSNKVYKKLALSDLGLSGAAGVIDHFALAAAFYGQFSIQLETVRNYDLRLNFDCFFATSDRSHELDHL